MIIDIVVSNNLCILHILYNVISKIIQDLVISNRILYINYIMLRIHNH